MLKVPGFSARTPSNRFTLGIRFERFLVDFAALLDRFVAMFTSSFDLVWIYLVQPAWSLSRLGNSG